MRTPHPLPVRTPHPLPVRAPHPLLIRTPHPLPMCTRRPSDRTLYEKYKDEILFMGISSFEDYPMDAMNPYSPRLDTECAFVCLP